MTQLSQMRASPGPNPAVMSQRNVVLELVKTFPGRTALELAGISVNLDRYQVARRLADLEHSELVCKGESRECIAGQRTAVTWFAE